MKYSAPNVVVSRFMPAKRPLKQVVLLSDQVKKIGSF